MLEAISWKEYGIAMGGALCLYYGWWFLKYAASLGWNLPKPKDPINSSRLTGLYLSADRDDRKEPAKETTSAAGGTSAVPGPPEVSGAPAPAPSDGAPFLASAAGFLLKDWAEFMEKAASEKMAEGEFVSALQQLLSAPPYQRLKGTIFQEKVSDRIIRDVDKLGSIRLDALGVKGLWDG